jgi:hypothetical protein
MAARLLRLHHVKANTVTKILSQAEVDNAIFLDFEGRKNQPPALLGVLSAEGKYQPHQDKLVMRQDVVASGLRSAENALTLIGLELGVAHHLTARALGTSLRETLLRARAQGRLIVAWSQHDLDMSLEYGNLGRTLRSEMVERYRDGKKTAKRWANTLHPEFELEWHTFGGKHKLAAYMEFVGVEVPGTFGPGLVAKNIKKVGDAVAKHGNFDQLTVGQQLAWDDVLGHNAYDLLGMREVLRRATAEMADASMLVAV